VDELELSNPLDQLLEEPMAENDDPVSMGQRLGGWANVLLAVIGLLTLLGVGPWFYNEVWEKKLLTYTILPTYDLGTQVFTGVVIENRGRVTLTDVKVVFSDLGDPIDNVNMPGAHEPAYIATGGIGQEEMLIEMPRLSKEASLSIYLLTSDEVELAEGTTLYVSSSEVNGKASSETDSPSLEISIAALFFVVATIAASAREVRNLIRQMRRPRAMERETKAEVTQAAVSVPDRELETSRRQPEAERLTRVSGSVGEFSDTRDGPWRAPVACNPVHNLWGAIEEATWVWIKQRPNDQEAQKGQVVWHRFDFQLDHPFLVTQATLSLLVDDLAEVFVNGQPAGKASSYRRIAKLDVKPYLESGRNTVEMQIENAAIPNSTGRSNPTGVIYRLEIH
jgi:hypothetical protein